LPYPSVITPPSRFVPQGRKRARYEMATRFRGLPGHIPLEPVRAHVDTLHGMGLPLASIARDAGCTPATVRNIHCGVWAKVRTRHALAIKSVTHHPNPRQQVVLAIGAVRRAQALHAIGWTWRALAEHTPGVTAGAIATMTRPGHERTLCAWETWAVIRDAYEKLSGTPGPEGVSAMKARNAAKRRKWLPPLNWEDLDIDDPRVRQKRSGPPSGNGAAERRAARRRTVARLSQSGLSAEEIAARMRVSSRTIVRDRQWLDTHPDVLADEEHPAA
jgi:lambda repressor-like predicted transcriptional regulator